MIFYNFELQNNYMKKLITTCIALVLLQTIFSQVKVTGTVKTADQKPVRFASISISDSNKKIIATTVTDVQGFFEIKNLKAGKNLLRITSTGFENYEQELAQAHSLSTIQTVVIVLKNVTGNLQNVTVTSKKKFIEVRADRTILNIEQNIMASGSSVFEMIKKGPAVSADKDDNLKLKGAIAKIYIDGKPSNLSGQALTDYLKNLPADAVSRIEIIASPNSSFDAEGSAGIINIKLKKSTAQGLNGSANMGTGRGRYGKVNGGINMNFREGKWNVFTNLSGGIYKSFNELILNNIAVTSMGTLYQDRFNFWNPLTRSGNGKFGIDYSVSKKTTIGILINQSGSSSSEPVINKTTFSNGSRQVTSFVNTTKTDDKKDNNATYNINLKTLLDSLGSELNIDADVATYAASGTDINTNYYTDLNNQPLRTAYIFRNNTPAKVNIFSSKIDYSKQLNEKTKIEFGAKVSHVNTDNNLIADSLNIITSKWLTDYNRNNQFIYTENIQALYGNINFSKKKWEFQVGLRAENTSYTANSITNKTIDKKNYLSLFPSVFTTYKFNDNHQFNFNFTRRISRPSYSSLNPFLNYVDPFTIFAGNPYLQPAFNYNFEIKHSYKSWLFSSLSYRYQTNMSDNVITQNEDKTISTSQDKNVGVNHFLNADITAVIPITKWWNTENNFGANAERAISTYPGYTYKTNNINGYFSSDHTFTLPKNYRLQAGMYYSTPSVSGFRKQRSSYGGNIGVQKQLFEKKATIKFTINNIGINAYRAYVKNDNLNLYWQNKWEGPRFGISFSYRFGKASVKASRQRKTASAEESGRAGF